MTRAAKLKLAAYVLLLLTLFLPFSRCSHPKPGPPSPSTPTVTDVTENPDLSHGKTDVPAPAEPPGDTSGLTEIADTLATAPNTTTSPWYHLFERNSPEAEYKYGMDLLIESWVVPPTRPREFDPVMLVPGRMFYVWPLATLALAWWWPPMRWRRSFHLIEMVLGLGGMWWAMAAAFLNEAMRGFYIAEAALALYVLAALWELIAQWRRLRRERRSLRAP
jgi:hypothetical protein